MINRWVHGVILGLLLLVQTNAVWASGSFGGGGGGTTTGIPTVINIKDAPYSAKCDGSTDDTTAIQAALDAVTGNGNIVYIPAGSCLINGAGSAILTLSKGGTILRGAGRVSRLLVKSTVGATTDVLLIRQDANDMLGITLEDFGIVAQSGTPARDAIVINTSVKAIYQFRINRVITTALGGWAIRSVNATPVVNGFFTSTIQNSSLNGGITLQNAGDTIIIEHNIETGANTCLVATFVTGAADLRYTGNNCTTTAGAISLTTNTYHAIIADNEIATTGTVAGATINLTGNHIIVAHNQVNTASTIQINATSTRVELLGNAWDSTTTVADSGQDTLYIGNITNGQFNAVQFTSDLSAPLFLRRTDNAHTSLPALQLRRLRADSTAPNAGTGVQLDFMIEGNTDTVPYVTSRLESILEQNQTDGTTTRDAKLRLSTILNNSLTGYLDLMSSGNFQPVTNGVTMLGGAGLGFGRLYMDYTNTGTIGAVTINKAVGRANIAAGASSVVVTNSVVTAASHCFATLQANDTTALYVRSCVTGSGTMTITTTANATANTAVDFMIVNAD